jgi:hypothetical protein
LREGHGKMEWIDGTIYIGMWIEDIQNGMGKIIYPDGSSKEGMFKNNVLIQEFVNDQPVI